MVRLSGASRLQLEADIDALELVQSGASTVILAGQGENVTLQLSGASDVNGREYSVNEVTVRLSGASDATIQVDETLSATLSGASTLRYIGDPAVTETLSGASGLRKLD